MTATPLLASTRKGLFLAHRRDGAWEFTERRAYPNDLSDARWELSRCCRPGASNVAGGPWTSAGHHGMTCVRS